MLKHALPVILGVTVMVASSGCDAQRWVATFKSKLPAAGDSAPRIAPAYSESGRVEAKLLNTPYGPPLAPKAKLTKP
jgi:hypothetical protein